MACSYCDRSIGHCRCRKARYDYPHRSHRRTLGHSRSWRDESPSCQSSYDYHESRPRSRHRYYSDDQLSSCESKDENTCRRGRSKSVYVFDDHGIYASSKKSKRDKDKSSKGTDQTLRVELFEVKKKAKKYDEATDTYRDALDYDKSCGSSDQMLNLKTSFADMQVNLGNCSEAERVLEDILKWNDLPGGVKSQCTSIHGKILCERKRYTEAENLYRKLYDRASKDEVSLQMGDEMCNAIALQSDLDRAHIEYSILLEKQKKTLGAGHAATVKSANKAVGNIRKLIQKLSKDYEPEGQRNWKRKQALEADIEDLLRDIWGSMASTLEKQEGDSLKIGFELGLSLSNQRKFFQAENVLQEVWKGRKISLGELNKDTLSAGICLGQAMYRQELDGQLNDQGIGGTSYHPEFIGTGLGRALSTQTNFGGVSKCQIALPILYSIRETARKQAYGDMHSIGRAAGAHLGILCAWLRDYSNAQCFLSNIANFAYGEWGVLMPPPRLLDFAQKQMNSATPTMVWNPKSKRPRPIGRRVSSSRPIINGLLASASNGYLTGAYPSQLGQAVPLIGPSANRLAIIAGPMNAVGGSGLVMGQGDVNTYRQALSEGRRYMALRNYSKAGAILRDAWYQEASTPQEQRFRATVGDKYGACLNQLGQNGKAAGILQDVKTLKRQIGLTGRELGITEHLIGRSSPMMWGWY